MTKKDFKSIKAGTILRRQNQIVIALEETHIFEEDERTGFKYMILEGPEKHRIGNIERALELYSCNYKFYKKENK